MCTYIRRYPEGTVLHQLVGEHFETFLAEARGAESRRDFVHRLGIALKELQETR